MPHPVSPPSQSNMIVPVKAADGAAPAPSQAEVSSLLDTVFNAKTSNASIEASYALCTTPARLRRPSRPKPIRNPLRD